MTRRYCALIQKVIAGGTAIFVLSGSNGAAQGDEAIPQFLLPPLDEFWAIVERPLLAPSRRPNDTTILVPEDGADPKPQFLLVGTATDQGDRAVAIIRNLASSTEFQVWIGDTFGGWQVKAIAPRSLILVNAGVETSITLDEPLVPEIAAQH